MATKADKQAVVEELVEDLTNSEALYIAEYTGMTVADVNNLRGKFRESGIKYKVYKNTLARRAMDQIGGYNDLPERLENQNAFIFAGEELGQPAKILKKFIADNKKPSFKMAYIEGQIFESNQLDVLASMKSKTEIIGDIVGLLLSPVSNIVSALQSQGSNILGAIKQVAEKDN